MDPIATRRIAERFSRLTPEQRRAVYQKIRAEGLSIGQFPILPRDRPEPDRCPLSSAQLRQWFLWQLDPKSTAYHISGALKLKGTLDADAVRESFAALVARHESLRAVFRADAEGFAEQVIRQGSDFDMQTADFADAQPARRNALCDEEARRLSTAPFDLGSGPLLRVGLIRLAADEHMLVVVMHHIVSDGWSMQIIVAEFVAQYSARVRATQAEVRPLPIQYADYAVWQRNWLEAGEKERQLVYWKEQLGSEHPVLQLPTDHARRAEGNYRAKRKSFELSPALTKGLQKRAQAQGATLFMLLLTAFQALLHRYTGQQDIRVGVPIANRHRVEIEAVIGFFVNTQVLRSVVDSRSSLAQLLAKAKESALGAQVHQDLPFEQLVEALQPERSLGTSPLFQVMFNHQRADFNALGGLPGLTLEEHGFEEQAAQLELTLDTLEAEDGRVQASFSYAAELFEPQTIARMTGHYLALLDALAAHPEQAVGDVELLGEAEQAQLRQWGAQRQAGRADVGEAIHHLVERHARQKPEAPALVFGEETLSYGELNARANRLAHRLISLGVKPESRVGIAVERSIGMVVGLLAILKAGGAYVPLDPEYPADRLAYMVGDSGIELLLTQSSLGPLPGAEAVGVLKLDTLDTSFESEADPQVRTHGENLAYVIYTSGSTGRPKGAQLCHRNVTRLLAATEPWFGFGGGDVWTMFHSYAFDFSVWEIFGALCTGGKLVIVPFWVSRSPEDFLALLRDQRVTVLNQTPSAFGQLVALPQAYERELSLRVVIFGGEALDPQRLRPWIAHYGDDSPQLINMYGITETTVHVTYRRITAADLAQQRSPMGIGIPDLGLRVLDSALEATPIGVAGELFVSGAGLSRGYLKRAALTAERFVATEGGQRLYRTGDLVRWNAEGQLEYLGRIDHQVKVRGFRIELGEIEAQLLAQPEVREAIVIANEGPAGTRLVAYVSPQAEHVIEVAMLKDALGRVLPDYMVPAAVVVLDALPLNANGKVDRKALPDAEFGSAQAYEAPQGGVEEALSQIWSQVLGVERVGRNDNFFELGGHSLMALRLLEAIRAKGWTVQVRTLFQHSQLAAFAEAMLLAQGQVEVVVPPNGIPEGCDAIEPGMLTLVDLDAAQIARIEAQVAGGSANIQDIYPLAPLQEGMLFHHLLQAEGDAYITSHALSFDSKERLERFIGSFNQVIARHDILRTAVLWEGLKEPVQVVHRHAKLALQWLDVEPADAAARLHGHVDPARYRIDVRQAPMIHAVAAHDPVQGRWLLQLPSHHMVLDHTTLEFLVEEISLIQQGRQEALPEPMPFRNYVAQARLGVSQAEHEAFFTQMLGDVNEPTAPFDLLDVQSDGARVEEARLALAPALAQQIRREAQRHGVSAATLFHLAWALVLARATGKDDVVFGTVLFGRMQAGEGGQRALGLFINTLPLRVSLGAQGVAQCLKGTHAMLTQLLHHEHANLSLAQRCSALPGGMPLFSALLNYRHGASNVPDQPVRAWDGMEVLSNEERTNYPFVMSVDDLDDGFALVAQIVGVVDAQRICRFMEMAIGGIVEALQKQPGQPIRELELLSAQERAQLLTWGENKRPVDSVTAVHRLFEAQAKAQPQATAVIFGEESLSYAELNAQANRLAHRLIVLGVKPESRVGIAMERSPQMVVALLGILKAGGAYVPLDPAYPQERLAYMVADSGIELLLTHSALGGRIPGSQGFSVLELDRLQLQGEPAHDPQVAVHADNLAYVIYTSGSTGKPKGVEVLHRAIVRLVGNADYARLDSSVRMLQFAPLAFDASTFEIWGSLCNGGVLVQAPAARPSFDELAEVIEREHVTTAWLTAALFNQMLESHPQALGGLRQLLSGGEAMSAHHARQALERFGQAELVNGYGPTECTTFAVCQAVRASDVQRESVPLGGPIVGTACHVLDASLHPVPQGVVGELYLGGAGLARGYLKQAGLTAERFVATEGGQRLYRTGDLVRWNAEGQLEYLGRIDHQVKVRGFRIELGEIEAQLLAQENVREAVVVANQGPAGARLVGYVSGQDIDTAVLRARLAEALPDYMVPGAIVVLDALPLNANGKVDRKALPDAEFGSAQEYEAPQGEVEEALSQIWSQVLGVERVGRNDNFFELGGHSIAVLRMQTRMQKQFSVQLPLRTYFENPTLVAIGAILQAESRTAQNDEADELGQMAALLEMLED